MHNKQINLQIDAKTNFQFITILTKPYQKIVNHKNIYNIQNTKKIQ
jgi:hypothetical protein